MAMHKALLTMGSVAILGALKLLYPPHCPLCQADLASSEESTKRLRFVCEGCLAQIRRVEPPYCARCGDPLLESGLDLCNRCGHEEIPFERARSYGIYEGALSRLIQLLKFHGERALARELAPLLAQMLHQEDWAERIEGITFVPMSRKSFSRRGFNQSELLARHLGKILNKPVFPTLLKTRETQPQVDLSGEERLENLKDVFAPLAPAHLESVLLIDDVYTTGSTIKECSRALCTAGYQHVHALTLARTPLPSSSDENAHES